MSEHADPSTCAIVVHPRGLPHFARVDGGDAIDAPAAKRIEAAFAKGSVDGVLYLGTSAGRVVLTGAFAFWREFAHRCVLAIRGADTGTIPPAPSRDELDALVTGAPPMAGGEYLSADTLLAVWALVDMAARSQVTAHSGSVDAWLASCDPSWGEIGRVCFHLAENKRHPSAPFAFLATYTTRVDANARVQHVPLGRALEQYAGAKNRAALLSLLKPVQRASERSELVRTLLDSGEIYRPQAWSPREAYAFLREVHTLEDTGVIVRVPDWWKSARPPRVQVRVTVGTRKPSQLGLNALMDFSVGLAVGDERVTEAELNALLAQGEGLVLLKGKWVEVDRAKLTAMLDHWKEVQSAASDGVPIAEALRMLAGANVDAGGEAAAVEASADWANVTGGAWLGEALAGLRDPERLAEADPGAELHATLRPYQTLGVRWLWALYKLGLGGCLADDMGLGKTIQLLALLLLVRRGAPKQPSLLVLPTSLLGNWSAELARFAPSLRTCVVHPSSVPGAKLAKPDDARLAATDLVITTYGLLHRLDWLAVREWNLVVLDEAQAIKNPGARQTRATKALRARVKLTLTGTPVENRLGELWSLFDFTSPGLLGDAKSFSKFTKRLADSGASGYAPLRNLVRPYILRRLKTDRRIIDDLPDKTEVRAFCSLTKQQAALYQQSVDDLGTKLEELDGIQRRGVVLAYLMRLKQICNHPSQWLGDGKYAANASGKFARLREVCDEIASRQERVLVFTQFREMTAPLAGYLAQIFGREGLVLHGETAAKKRTALVEQFQREDGPPFFVLSLKAGGTGLNLTAASHVVHFDRWWNPAVENQATDRAFRIGQKRNVLVHKFVCKGTIEERIDAVIEEKQALSRDLLEGTADATLTEMANDALMKMLRLDINSVLDES